MEKNTIINAMTTKFHNAKNILQEGEYNVCTNNRSCNLYLNALKSLKNDFKLCLIPGWSLVSSKLLHNGQWVETSMFKDHTVGNSRLLERSKVVLLQSQCRWTQTSLIFWWNFNQFERQFAHLQVVLVFDKTLQIQSCLLCSENNVLSNFVFALLNTVLHHADHDLQLLEQSTFD